MTKKQILILILILAAVLRLYGLSRGDTISDEVFMSFRGLGMIDFDEASAQTTPWEWRDADRPWWTNLSMHDHPWGVPLTHNLFMKIFGENNFAFRLPSALLGIASVYVLYRIGALLYAEEIGLIAAGILAVTLNNVYISRIGMQESYVIFAILLGSLYFLKSLKDPKYLLWVGIIIGIGAEMKYTALILVPIVISCLVLFRRSYFRNKYFWFGAVAVLVLFSPTIIYNLELYRATGHFDFQFSSFIGGRPEVWKIQPGKEIGTLGERIQNFIPRLIASNSWLFLSLAVISLSAFLISLVKNFKVILKNNTFLLLVIGYLLLLLMLIGPSYRFLTMLTPFLALGIGIFLSSILEHSHILKNVRMSRLIGFAFMVFFFFEIFYSINNQILYYPFGPNPWLASNLRYENYNWGYNKLSEYLEKEFSGKMPAITFDVKYQFLENLRQKAINGGLAKGLEQYPALIVYEGNFDGGAKLWVLDRLHIYHAWPIISLQTYYDYLKENGFDYYQRSGFREIYFIEQTNWVAPGDLGILTGGRPIRIQNEKGDEVFKVYKNRL